MCYIKLFFKGNVNKCRRRNEEQGMKKATDRPQGHSFGLEIPINNPLQSACNVT